MKLSRLGSRPPAQAWLQWDSATRDRISADKKIRQAHAAHWVSTVLIDSVDSKVVQVELLTILKRDQISWDLKTNSCNLPNKALTTK